NWLGVPLKSDGEPIGVLVIQSYSDRHAFDASDLEMLEFVCQQISISIERKLAEQEITGALEKAMESDRLKSAFLATMSHELRTPLNAVIGFSQLIDAETPMEDVLEFAKHILKGGHHLLAIIEDILNISVLESGLVDVTKENCYLMPFLDQVDANIKSEQAKMQKQHLSIRSSFGELDPNLWICTDSEKLQQILMNLLNNAVKFTNEGSVEYGALKELREDRPHLKFWVRDTGIGMSAKVHGIIFDMFRQADETHTRTHGGTGIGLSVSKKLVELMGGSIWVESEVGKGSTFWFTIPFERESHVEEILHHEKKSGQELTFAGKTILIAEDEESNYELLDVLLSGMGCNLLWAKNGREAVQLCFEYPELDLILMDLKMPVMSGYEATGIIRESNPMLPIIAQTAYAMPSDREEAIEAGCNDFITKPIRKEKLYKTIEKCLK
ncbi:MAG: response regulator, partial [Bacteroidia bacterium]|nr:response regulator [Bacteroidia bacterium]